MGKPKVWVRTRGKSILVFWERLPEVQREQKSFKRDREGAEEFAAEKRLELRSVGPLSAIDRNVTVRAYSALWMAELEKAASRPGHGLQFNTLVSYRQQIAKICPPPSSPAHPALGEYRLRDVNQNHIEAFLSDRLRGEAAYGSVQLLYRVLRRMFERARYQGVIQVNCVRGLWKELPGVVANRKSAEDERQRKALTFDELQAFIAATSSVSRAHAALWYTAAKTGVRLGEALALHASDVLLGEGKLGIRRSLDVENKKRSVQDRLGPTKNRTSRVFEMSPALTEFLADYIPWRRAEALRKGWGSDWLFLDEDGGPIGREAAAWSFKRIAKAAGISGKYSPHGLRHAYASHNLTRGAALVWVAKQLGHSPQVCLKTYAWAMPDADRGWAGLIDGTKREQESIGSRSSSEHSKARV